MHVRPVIGLEVPRIDANALGADWMVLWREKLGGAGILDDLADLAAYEVGRGVVGLLIEDQVVERGHEGSAAGRPALFVNAVAFLGGDGEGGEIVRIGQDAVARIPGL